MPSWFPRQSLVLGLVLLTSVASCTRIRTVYVHGDDPDHPPTTAPPSTTPPTPTGPPTSTVPVPGLDPDIFPKKGATTFTTANDNELLSTGTGSQGQYRGGNSARGELAGEADDAAAEPSAATPVEAQPDVSRDIVEGDIFKVEGSLLYVLHRYRGLLIFDLSTPDQLKLIGRLPFQAMPVEMYVKDGRVHAVVSDYFSYWQYDRDADPLGFHGSSVLVADVSQPTSPILLGQKLIDGQVTETRMVGDVLYVVSRRNPDYWRYNTADWEDTTWVKSINVADPDDIRDIETLEFAGSSTLMHVYHHAIFVAAHDPNAYLVDPAHENETLVTYVDISDAAGTIRQRGQLYVPGFIADKFKMDYHEGTLRVLSQRSLGGQSDGFVHSVDVSHPDRPQLVASLDLGVNDYGWLTASRMDGDRGYAVTQRYDQSRSYSELHVLDLSDAAAPRRAGSLRIDGWVSHFEVRGDRLLAMGQTYEANGSWSTYATVTVYDVANAAAPRRLSVARLGEGSSYSLANGDYKAFRVMDDLGLILVPLSFYNNNTYFNGTQLIDYAADAVTPRGVVGNAGTVERAFAVGDRLVALSQHQIQIIDARDRGNPVVTSSMNLIRNVLGIWDVQGKQVQLVGEVLSTGTRLEVIPFGVQDDAPSLATLELPYASAPVVFRDGDVLRLIGWEENGQVIRNADLSNPLAPRLRGQLTLTDEFERIYNDGYPFYYLYWSPWAGLPLENRILPVTVRRIVESDSGRRDFQSWLRLIDLRDIDRPRVADGEVPMPEWPFVNKVTHGTVLHSSHVEETKSDDGSTLLFHVKAYLDRIDVSDPDRPRVLEKVNIPGYLVDVSDDAKTGYTVDYQWDAFGRRRNSLNVLQLGETTATLTDVLPVGDQVNRAVFRDRTIWLVTHKYPWWGVQDDTLNSRQPYTALSRIDVDTAGTIVSQSSARLAGYSFELLDVEGDRAFLASNAPTGVLVLDISDAARPLELTNARTVGYVSRVLVNQDVLYMPLGYFGVHRVPLQ